MSKIHPLAIAVIKHFESLHDGDSKQIGLQPKMCPAGIWTVGWGHALRSADGSRFLKGEKDKAEAYQRYPEMTEAQAEALLADDLASFASGVDELIKVDVTDDMRGALISFAYNVGIGNFQTSTLLKLLNAGDFEGASKQFPVWNKGTVNGKRQELKGLTLRRQAEMLLFLGLHDKVKAALA